MNLAFCLFKYYPFGGLEKNFLNILKETLSRGHHVSIFTMKWDGEVPDFIENGDCQIITIPHSGFCNHAKCKSFVRNLKTQLEEKSFDFVFGFNRMPGLDLYYCADVCFKADVRKRRSPLFKLTSRYRVYAKFEETVFSPQSSTHILALSHIQKEIYKQEYGTQEERFHPIPAGINKERIKACLDSDKTLQFRQELNIDKNDKILLMIGSDFTRKGVSRTLTALASLPEKIKNKTKLFVIGKGKEAKFLSLAKKFNVLNQVKFTGGVDNVPQYLAAADILIHPAISENTGNAIVEALIAGLPVITTSNCGYAMHVEKSKAGIVIDGNDFMQENLNAAIKKMVSMPQKDINDLKELAINYSNNTDFYSRPKVVADIIEKLSKNK